ASHCLGFWTVLPTPWVCPSPVPGWWEIHSRTLRWRARATADRSWAVLAKGLPASKHTPQPTSRFPYSTICAPLPTGSCNRMPGGWRERPACRTAFRPLLCGVRPVPAAVHALLPAVRLAAADSPALPGLRVVEPLCPVLVAALLWRALRGTGRGEPPRRALRDGKQSPESLGNDFSVPALLSAVRHPEEGAVVDSLFRLVTATSGTDCHRPQPAP